MLSIEKPLWGAPRTHGKLLKLGFAVARSSADSTWSAPDWLAQWCSVSPQLSKAIFAEGSIRRMLALEHLLRGDSVAKVVLRQGRHFSRR
jgi:hypothetical protein